MGWFNAKKEEGNKPKELPELPELPENPEKPSAPGDTDHLPNIGVKSSQPSQPPIVENKEKEVEDMRHSSPPKATVEQAPLKGPYKDPKGLGYSKTTGYLSAQPKITEPIYIRLDKFEATVENFQEIKEKINEIENLLAKAKEIRAKEEEELSDWEQEIQVIKSRIEYIDRNLLDKLD